MEIKLKIKEKEMYISDYPNRTMCDVLEEMRSCCKTLNFCGLIGLIEEAQSFANRMEAALEDKRDIRGYTKRRSELRKELRELRDQAFEFELRRIPARVESKIIDLSRFSPVFPVR